MTTPAAIQPDALTTTIATPLGDLGLVAEGGALVVIRLPGPAVPLPRAPHMPRPYLPPLDRPSRRASARSAVPYQDEEAVLGAARRQLDEYFAGERKVFDLPLELRGTAFQRAVWRALLDVEYGATESYSTIAERIGRPGAQRAVGAAVGSNPLPVVVPCHRIVGADGRLTGFGGGLPRKRLLLALERTQPPSAAQLSL